MKIQRMKIISRAMSQIDLFVELGAKFLHQKIVNLITKTILSTWSFAVEMNFKRSRVHFIKSCIVFFWHFFLLMNRLQKSEQFVQLNSTFMILDIFFGAIRCAIASGKKFGFRIFHISPQCSFQISQWF